MISLLEKILEENKDDEHLVLGDFNLHHFKWGENHIIADADAYELIIITEKYRLKRTLSAGTITWRRGISESTIDLAFVTSLLRESVIDVEIAVNMDNHSDHYSIKTTFELRTIAVKQRIKRNWEKTDLALLQKILLEAISQDRNLTSIDQYDNSDKKLDRQVEALTKAIQETIDAFTSWINICSRSKSGFTQECKEASRSAKRARRVWQETMNQNDWENYKVLRNKLGRVVKKAMKEQFRKETADGCESSAQMWSKCK